MIAINDIAGMMENTPQGDVLFEQWCDLVFEQQQIGLEVDKRELRD